ncbi:MAG: site-specific DNA-methyltransferase [bacterium]
MHFENSSKMGEVPDSSVDLIVTSPPYPMIEMWDSLFFQLNPEIKLCFDKKDFLSSFTLMHDELNKTWIECERVLKDGGIACINIGDATRTLDKDFRLWSNHTMINKFFMLELKLKPLPIILWRKSTNKPNKFMGSGMLPPSAYVTLEHEYILVFRKGDKREFQNDKEERYEAAFFWEERNNWFSDVWFDIVGTRQNLNGVNEVLRKRSAAFPLELANRLINMYSIYQDTVLDPFMGTGTTAIAAMMLQRNSIGYEIHKDFHDVFVQYLNSLPALSREYNENRLSKHIDFIENWDKSPKYKNKYYDFGVVTSQERNIKLYDVENIAILNDGEIKISYKKHKFKRAAKKKHLAI